MPLNVVLDLSDEDLAYFSRLINSVWKQSAKMSERELIAGARAALTKAQKARVPPYVAQRLNELGVLIDMLEDSEWTLPDEHRRRIKAAVSYFAHPKDIVSDRVPGIGYLDDALIADLVMRELKHDIEGYAEFCEYRATGLKGHKPAERAEVLNAKRDRLLDRIDRRRERMWSRMREDRLTDPILSYKY